MSTNRPRCSICGNPTKKNGTTTKDTTRWRCIHCGASTSKTRPDITARTWMNEFISHLT
ncbi:IS256 family transposase, partial [Corynebacterium choanae]